MHSTNGVLNATSTTNDGDQAASIGVKGSFHDRSDAESTHELEWPDKEELKSEIGMRWSRPDVEENSSDAEKIKQIMGKLPKWLDWFDANQIDATTSVLGAAKRNFVIQAESDGLSISSGHLQDGLRKIIPFSQDLDLVSDPMFISQPHRILYWYLPRLQELINEQANPAALKDLRVLTYYYHSTYGEASASIKQSVDKGEISYAYLWALFPPNELLITKNNLGEWQAFSCLSVEEQVIDYGFSVKRWCIKGWRTAWVAATRQFARRTKSFKIGTFSGNWTINTLPIYPLKFHGDEETRTSLISDLTERGRRWREVVTAEPPLCRMHTGVALPYAHTSLTSGFKARNRSSDSALERKVLSRKGRLILDERHSLDSSDSLMHGEGNFDDRNDRDDDGRWDQWLDGVKHEDKSLEYFSDELALHSPGVVSAFDLSAHSWCVVTVTEIREIEWEDQAMTHLVLDENEKRMLCSLVDDHSQKIPKRIGDVISGKGLGLTIVLHGPPGVGKTLTAESIAERLKRPLITMGLADLVGRETEATLETIFAAASHWGAILLLDEADVVLEQRSFENLERNAYVSMFLRQLEYFNGVLFLTTNRLETMDSAFQSRIQIALQFNKMGVSTRRKIWQRFAKLLKDDDDQAEIEENIDELKKLPLNGRQIRNVVNIAQTLAVSSNSRLKFEHIKKAADKTVAFDALFQNAGGSNVSSVPKSRLRKNFERSDSFKNHSNDGSDEE